VGRPREFDMNEALRAALLVFWDKGYDGASLTDLSEAMGIVRPSLKAAFGTKEELYSKALDLYARETMGFVVDALRGSTATEVVHLYLSGFCEMVTNADGPGGCFLIKAMGSSGTGGESARVQGIARLSSYETLLEQRFRRAHDDGDLARDVDARSLAESVMTIAGGLSLRADLGASRADLERIVRASMRNLL
jgi:AcrR family transcriptional regulator